MTADAYKKFNRDSTRGISRECARCGALRLYGHACAHCGAFILTLKEFGDALKMSFEQMTPEQQQTIKNRTRASVIWEKEVAHRPYDLERLN
jgi:hypothetical protein